MIISNAPEAAENAYSHKHCHQVRQNRHGSMKSLFCPLTKRFVDAYASDVPDRGNNATTTGIVHTLRNCSASITARVPVFLETIGRQRRDRGRNERRSGMVVPISLPADPILRRPGRR